jgi:hypothetical protein
MREREMARHNRNIGFFSMIGGARCRGVGGAICRRRDRWAKGGVQRLATNNCALTGQQRFGERFSARQLGLACAWRCRAQGTSDWNTPPLHREF